MPDQNPFLTGNANRAASGPSDVPQAGIPTATPAMPGLAGLPGLGSASGQFEVDLTGVESGGFIEPGIYDAYLDRIEPGVTRGGDPKFMFFYRIVNHPQYAGRTVTSHLSINSKWKIKDELAAMGQPTDGRVSFSEKQLKYIMVIIMVGESEGDKGERFYSLDEVLPWPADRGGIGTRYSPPQQP